MARQKKSEIDAILEQLKISYFDDSQDIEEESPAESHTSDEDAELAAVLEKIFTESEDFLYHTHDNDKSEDQVEQADEEQDEPVVLDTATDEKSDEPAPREDTFESDPVLEEINEVSTDELINTTTHTTLEETFCDDAVKTEEDRVDDVLKSMFQFASLNAEVVVNDEVVEAEPETTQPISSIEETAPEIAEVEELIEIDSSVIDHAEDVTPIATQYEAINEDTEDEEAFTEKESLVESDQSEPSEEYADVQIAEYTNEESIAPRKKIITDPKEYVDDIMQYSLSAIPFYKPQKDVDFSIFEILNSNENKGGESEKSATVEATEPKNEISDKEISLLMKLGYSGEINASGENEHAHKVIFNESKNYVPEKHKITHGFAGGEFASRAQIPDIKKKFKQDRLIILIQAIIVSLIALASVVTDFVAVFSFVSPVLLISVSFWSSLAILLILCTKIVAGVSALFKFDTNQYSLPSIIVIECFVYNLITALILFLGNENINTVSIISVSGYALLYMAITVWGEWIDCYKESAIFNFIADNGKMYVAEKRTSADVSYNENKRRHASVSEEFGNRYIVKQAKFVSGFHKKTASGKSNASNVFFTIAVIPAIAIIVGLVVALFNDSLVAGLSGMSFILFLSAPLLNVVSLSLIELLNQLKLKKNNSVLIGSKASFAISNIQSVVFEDKDVIDIVDYTPINPNKNSDNPQKWLNIASRVFETLGGPLSNINRGKTVSLSNVDHDVAINSISDNGVDLYFDSSMNILIGDRAYMQSHNINVKTDVNLTGATRGANRSVIYMAFDKVPQIGFIVTSRIKRSFLKTIALLGSSGINIEVKSYEPEINELFFETNIPDSRIGAVKPINFESTSASDVSDCELASTNPLDICRAIVYSKVIANDIAKTKAHAKIQAVTGFLFSLVLCALICVPNNIKIVSILQAYCPVLFYAIALIMMIPNLIHTIKVLKRK